jgi:2-methylcitrate dehydratase
VLIDGTYSDAMFAPERYADRRTLDLMQKIKVTQDPDFNRQYPKSFPCRMEITMRNGERKIAKVANPIGHHDRPMSDEQVSAKFRGLAERKLSPKAVNGILERLWRIENEASLAPIFSALALDRAAS